MKTAKLFRNGQSQAVRLPKEFRFAGREVFIQRLGSCVILIPREDAWAGLFAAAGDFSPDFLTERDQGREQRREGLDR